ncbi:MFS transporter [Rhizorhabdus argentea]|uniref:MFS transporter n=1 Tax=Rhizorhabdus argentea TaxID=1387174 RepID=UPI0030EE9277
MGAMQHVEPAPAGGEEFRRGWKILIPSFVGGAFAMTTIAPIVIGSFVKPLGDDMEWSRIAVQAAQLFSQILGTIGVIVTGILLEKIGMRWAGIIGLAGTALGLLLVSLSQTLPYFYVTFALTALVGSTAGAITWSRAITREFDRHRGFALALTLSGSGLALFILPSIMVRVIGDYGWRAAFVALACFPALIALPAVLVLFKPREAAGPQAGDKQQDDLVGKAASRLKDIVGCYRFWALLLAVFCTYTAITAIVTNFIPTLTDDGLSAETAAAAQGAIGASMIISRLVIGFLLDRVWAPAVAALVAVPAAAGCLLLTMHPSWIGATIAAGLIGMAMGAELDLLAFLTSRYFKPAHFSRTYSYIYACAAVAGSIGPIAFASAQQITGTYDAGLYIAAGLFLLGGTTLLTLGRYRTNIGDAEYDDIDSISHFAPPGAADPILR